MSKINSLLCMLMVVSFSDCAFVTNLMPVERRQIEEAKKMGDVQLLEDVCNGSKRTRYSGDDRLACSYLKTVKASDGSCETLVSRYEGASKDWEFQKTMGRQFAKCGLFKDLFEKVVHWGNRSEGAKLLAMLEKEGFSVEKEFVKYATTNKGKKFMPQGGNSTKFALDNIGKWLINKGSTQHCAVIANAVQKAHLMARVWVLPYLSKAECKEGESIAARVLISDSWQHRMWACDALGDIGTPKILTKLKLLAETDSFSRVREERRDDRIWGVKEWPVRESCKAAFAKVQLRSS